MLTTHQKLMILDYAEHDGNVTLTLDEITQIFEEIEQLKEKNKKLKVIVGRYREVDVEKSVKLNMLENKIELLENELSKEAYTNGNVQK